MNNHSECKKDNCPYCGVQVMVRLNKPFFGDPRICGTCQSNMNKTSKFSNNHSELVRELREKFSHGEDFSYSNVAYFIIADRARIVAPLVKYKKVGYSHESADDAIDETLKLAGVKIL